MTRQIFPTPVFQVYGGEEMHTRITHPLTKVVEEEMSRFPRHVLVRLDWYDGAFRKIVWRKPVFWKGEWCIRDHGMQPLYSTGTSHGAKFAAGKSEERRYA